MMHSRLLTTTHRPNQNALRLKSKATRARQSLFATILLSVCGLFKTSPSHALGIKCDAEQKQCTYDNPDYTVGDFLGFYNSLDELLALGRVKRLDGERRFVDILRNYGAISRDSRVRLIPSSSDKRVSLKGIKIYQPPVKSALGLNLEFGSLLDLGDSAQALGIGAHYQFAHWRGANILVRLSYMTASSTVSRVGLDGIETQDFTFTGLSLLPGMRFEWGRTAPISLSVEFNLGLMQVNALIGGSAGLLEDKDYEVDLKNGLNPALRTAVGLAFNGKNWVGLLGISATAFEGTLFPALSLGLQYNLSRQPPL